MRHFFLTSALAASALAAQAQQNSFYIGGQAGFNSTSTTRETGGISTTTSKQNNYSFSPEVGTFLTNQVQLGVGFTFSGTRTEGLQTVGSITPSTDVNRYGGTVYSRYFFGEGNFRPFVGVNVSLLPGNSTTESGGPFSTTTESSTLDFGANINAGFGYGLTKRLAVVGSFGTFGYQSSTSKEKGTNNKISTDSFGLNANTLGNLFTVGVYYTFITGEKQAGNN